MKNKKTLITCALLLFALCMLAANFVSGGKTGRVIVGKNGSLIYVEDNMPMILSNNTVLKQDFSRYETGDKLLVVHGAIAESYPAQSNAYFLMKLQSGTKQDISPVLFAALTEMGWVEEDPDRRREDHTVTVRAFAASESGTDAYILEAECAGETLAYTVLPETVRLDTAEIAPGDVLAISSVLEISSGNRTALQIGKAE